MLLAVLAPARALTLTGLAARDAGRLERARAALEGGVEVADTAYTPPPLVLGTVGG